VLGAVCGSLGLQRGTGCCRNVLGQKDLDDRGRREHTGAYGHRGRALADARRDLDGDPRAVPRTLGAAARGGRGKGQARLRPQDIDARARKGRWSRLPLTGDARDQVRRGSASGGTRRPGASWTGCARVRRRQPCTRADRNDRPRRRRAHDALAELAAARVPTIAPNNVHTPTPADWKTRHRARGDHAMSGRTDPSTRWGWFPERDDRNTRPRARRWRLASPVPTPRTHCGAGP